MLLLSRYTFQPLKLWEEGWGLGARAPYFTIGAPNIAGSLAGHRSFRKYFDKICTQAGNEGDSEQCCAACLMWLRFRIEGEKFVSLSLFWLDALNLLGPKTFRTGGLTCFWIEK